mgnify:CR=1 FL=1
MNNINIGDLIFVKPAEYSVNYGINYDAPVMVLGKLFWQRNKKNLYRIVGTSLENNKDWKLGYCIEDEYVKHFAENSLADSYRSKYQGAWFSSSYQNGECVLFFSTESKYNIAHVTVGVIDEVSCDGDGYVICYIDAAGDYRKFLFNTDVVICRNWDNFAIRDFFKSLQIAKEKKEKELKALKKKGYLLDEYYNVSRLRKHSTNKDTYMKDPVIEYAEFYKQWGVYPSLCIADIYDTHDNSLIEEDGVIVIDATKKDRTENAKQVEDEFISFNCEDEISLFNLCKRHNGEDFFIKITRYE